MMRRMLVLLGLAATVAGAQGRPGGPPSMQGGVTIKDGEECPPGMTEVRPHNCRAPELPAPSILDYRPRSTLVTPEHLVPSAKYPVIDFHGHPSAQLQNVPALEQMGAEMDALNIGLMLTANNTSGDALKRQTALVASSAKMKDRVRTLTGVDFRSVGPGWAAKAVAQLDADVEAGAVGIGEIGKGLGLSIKKADGTRLRIDDPELDPIWDEAARLNIPVFIHTADPQEFWDEIDYKNERWLELALFPGRRYPKEKFPSFEELMTERDNLFKRHPKTTFVAAHLGWHANDLGRLGRMFDEMPNVYAEVGAVLYDIGRQPHGAHDFFVKYQDRLLFGKDSYQPGEYPYYWRVFETRDEYFDYYRHYHAFWKLYGIYLPDSVLKKVYYENALRIAPRLPQGAWSTQGKPSAQARTSLEGTWTQVDDRAGASRGATVSTTGDALFRTGSMGSGWGTTLTFSRRGEHLVLEYPYFSAYDLQAPVHYDFALDGAETENDITIGPTLTRLRTRVAMQGDTLVIVTRQPVPVEVAAAGTMAEVRRAVSLTSHDSLVIVTTRAGVAGAASNVVRSTYARKR